MQHRRAVPQELTVPLELKMLQGRAVFRKLQKIISPTRAWAEKYD